MDYGDKLQYQVAQFYATIGVGEMHAAFLRGDVRYFDDYEGRLQ